MAIRAQNIAAADWWTPDTEKDEQQPARFKLRGLSPELYADVQTEMVFRDGEFSGFTGKGLAIAMTHGLTDWENVLDDNDKPQKVTQANKKKLPYQYQLAIAMEVVLRSQLSDEERKNS